MSDLHQAVACWLGPDTAKEVGDEHQRTPEDVVEWVRPHWRRLGITRLADITGLDVVGCPVATCFRPNARTLSVAQGKGTTVMAAKASAVMEAVEFAHAERAHHDLTVASIDELRTDRRRLVHPDRLPRYGGTRTRSEVPLSWTGGTDLVDGSSTLVPWDAVHLDHVRRRRGPGAALTSSSNGLAAGADRAEAVTHALCELIERDALVRLERGTDVDGAWIDPASVQDPTCRSLLDRLAAAELIVEIVALSTPAAVPVLVAEVRPRVDDPFRPLAPAGGAGCHLDPATALRRALTEAAQTRLIDIAGVRDDLADEHYERLRATPTTAARPDEPPRTVPFHEVDDIESASTHDDVATLVGALGRLGAAPVAVDLTDPELGIPVVKVLATGVGDLPAMMTGRSW
ncbi:MAG: YcaO-like family protein [Desertimonas sp.]